MKTSILLIQTQPDDAFTLDLRRAMQEVPDMELQCFDLTGPSPDYDRLLDSIFDSDTVVTI